MEKKIANKVQADEIKMCELRKKARTQVSGLKKEKEKKNVGNANCEKNRELFMK